jgi:NADPH:quinone reductase-like Zn-dependent oxidoreductase
MKLLPDLIILIRTKIMKSIQIREYGSNDVVDVKKTVSVPNISSGKVLVSVKASGVNPVDWKIREGYFQQLIRNRQKEFGKNNSEIISLEEY